MRYYHMQTATHSLGFQRPTTISFHLVQQQARPEANIPSLINTPALPRGMPPSTGLASIYLSNLGLSEDSFDSRLASLSGQSICFGVCYGP
ncbi:hypothetical protein CH63R_04828 [Colletotrichum higginsianum IMI 349063]|uniref:Uncharacterized protein n=1 Tax=Colletotrichum higginsianum (strain IMI 349063) TaxID=759273 RepID=A0A1B7YKQ1_COLHI|nr:hypothetical protein CH63R_04828 [Colletotrichum higginsianum IMI 349063]OBR12532.1 hypothetical protein CH63R_04828 [Colletotrichum higginsianum IMI 349063]